MRIDFALLCDAVTVREGLLHVLGGGVSRMARPQFPSPLGAEIALGLSPDEADFGVPRKIRIVLLDPQGQQAGIIQADFTFNEPPVATAGRLSPAFMAVPASLLRLPGPGDYTFEITVGEDGNPHRLRFAVEAIELEPSAEVE